MDALIQAIKENPQDPLAIALYADWLEDNGKDREIAQTLAYEAIVDTVKDQVERQLVRANGNRRARTLTLDQCLNAGVKALQEGYAYTAGATVANAYRYPAFRTCCLAARKSNGLVRIAVDYNNARKGCSPITPFVPGFRRGISSPDRIMRWADNQDTEGIIGETLYVNGQLLYR